MLLNPIFLSSAADMNELTIEEDIKIIYYQGLSDKHYLYHLYLHKQNWAGIRFFRKYFC